MADNAVAEGMEMPKHGEFCWSEIGTNNLAECKKFYTNVFGWNFKSGTATDGDFEYAEYSVGNEIPMGGMFEMTEEICGGTPPPPHFMNYIAVDNVDETASKAFELGATIVKSPENIPNVGRFSIIKDPTGAIFAVISLK